MIRCSTIFLSYLVFLLCGIVEGRVANDPPAYNSRGDVVARTDDSGAATWQAAYEAFGTRTAEYGATAERQAANTKDEDPTGLLNEGYRYRDLEAGIFITRDPLGFVDGPNVYCYVRQNPWTKFDPLGLLEIDAGYLQRARGWLNSAKREVKEKLGGNEHKLMPPTEIDRLVQNLTDVAVDSVTAPIDSYSGIIEAATRIYNGEGTPEDKKKVAEFATAAAILAAFGNNDNSQSGTTEESSREHQESQEQQGGDDENKPSLPDDYWKQRQAPNQVTPGTRSVTEQKPSSRGTGEVYERTTHYDEYGRSTGQTHRTSHGEPTPHPNPHHHRRNPATGEEIRNPNPPGNAPKVWDGTHPDYEE